MEPHDGFVKDFGRHMALRRLKIAAVVTGLVVVGVAVGIGVAAYMGREADSFPGAASKVGFKLFVPAKLPAGMQLNNDAAVREGSVIFSAGSATNKIVFTEQPVPKDIKMEDFYALRIKGAKELEGMPFQTVFGNTPTGDAAVASVVTDSTWILITGPAGLPADDVKIIVQNLQGR